jgi:hypothetical protein
MRRCEEPGELSIQFLELFTRQHVAIMGSVGELVRYLSTIPLFGAIDTERREELLEGLEAYERDLTWIIGAHASRMATIGHPPSQIVAQGAAEGPVPPQSAAPAFMKEGDE